MLHVIQYKWVCRNTAVTSPSEGVEMSKEKPAKVKMSPAVRRHHATQFAWHAAFVITVGYGSIEMTQRWGWWWFVLMSIVASVLYVVHRRIRPPKKAKPETVATASEEEPDSYDYQRGLWFVIRWWILSLIFTCFGAWVIGSLPIDVLPKLIAFVAFGYLSLQYLFRRRSVYWYGRRYVYGPKRPFSVVEIERPWLLIWGGASDRYVLANATRLYTPLRWPIEIILGTTTMVVVDEKKVEHVITDIRHFHLIERIFDWQTSANVRGVDATRGLYEEMKAQRLNLKRGTGTG